MAATPEAIRALRHDLHRHPETAGEERETAGRVRDWLGDHGIGPHAEGIGGHGLLFRLGDGSGPATLLRADLDALPLPEDSGAAHVSEVDGRHHACGHDGHMAMLCGALAALADDPPEGTVYAFFQPAEETGEGMAQCLEDERLASLELDRCFAIHNIPGRPRGAVVVRDGFQAVASTGVHVRFEGRTSHAAEPHLGVNPIPTAARLVPHVLDAPEGLEDAVAAIVGIQGGGERYGTSAGDASLSMTLRAASDEELDQMVSNVTRYAKDLAGEGGVEVDVRRVEPFPATRNHPDAVSDVRKAARGLDLPTLDPGHPFPWSEDFGHATARWPGALLGLGAGEDHVPVHHPGYDFPDALLPAGVRLWVRLGGGGPRG